MNKKGNIWLMRHDNLTLFYVLASTKPSQMLALLLSLISSTTSALIKEVNTSQSF